MQILRLFRYLIPYRYVIFAAALTLIAFSSILLAFPWVLRITVNNLFISGSEDVLNGYTLLLLALIPVFGLSLYWQNYLMSFLNNRMIANLRKDVFNHLLELPLDFFSQHRLGAIISRVTSDIMFLQMTLIMATVDLLRQVVLLIGGLVLMLTLNWKLALMTLASLPVILLFFWIFSRKMRELSTIVQDKSADLTTEIEETLAGIKEIKSYTQENYEQERFIATVEERFDAMMQQNKVNALFNALIVTAGTVILIFLVWFGGYEFIHERLLPGDLIAMLFYTGIIIGPIRESAQKYSKIQQSIGASKRIFEILDSLEEKDAPDAFEINELKGKVEFDNVSFQYTTSSHPVIRNISFNAEPGMLIAIVGRSGAGKTTLVNLIPRFFLPQAGNIQIDGEDISRIKRSCLRRQIGLVPQETFLFGGTIADNIAYSNHGLPEARIIEAAKAACAHDFIMETPDQYKTVIGDRGIKLSAGQRQRIAIARLFLKDCRIVILDEATSSLDFESIRSLNKAIDNLLKDRTAFIITHNLSSIKKADLILVLENGEIVERGNHAQLLKMNGLYKLLYGTGNE